MKSGFFCGLGLLTLNSNKLLPFQMFSLWIYASWHLAIGIWFLENESHFTVVDVYCAERLRKWNFPTDLYAVLLAAAAYSCARIFCRKFKDFYFFLFKAIFKQSSRALCVCEKAIVATASAYFFYFSISLLLFFSKRLHICPEDYCTSNDHTNDISPIKKFYL